jgi:hydrogenase-4 component F
MGLAPMHTWLPDAHSESPSLVSALLSGALLNCAFLAILRAHQVLAAAGAAPFARAPLAAFGLLSMLVAVLFLVRQSDYKRALAYSSVEHMGVLALGIGMGGPAVFAALLHVAAHSLAKGSLFLVAGNLLARFATKRAEAVREALGAVPLSAALWLAGILAITGSPPFGVFLSEFTLLRGLLEQGQLAVALAYVALLSVGFAALLALALPMAFGAAAPASAGRREPWLAVAAPLLLGAAALLLGVYLPAPLARLLEEAARLVEGR